MRTRRHSGAVIAETAAAISLFVPIVVTLIFVTLETSHCFYLKTMLSEGARQAARDLAIQYGSNPAIAYDRALQDTLVFDYVRLGGVIASSKQFDTPTFNTGLEPHNVRVVVRYTSGQNGLPLFPAFDPLGLGSTLNLSANSTYRLE